MIAVFLMYALWLQLCLKMQPFTQNCSVVNQWMFLLLDDQEINTILQYVVERNKLLQCLYAKRHALESWRQLVEIILTACPQDLIQPEERQLIIRDLLQDVHDKVSLLKYVCILHWIYRKLPFVRGIVFNNYLLCFLKQSNHEIRIGLH